MENRQLLILNIVCGVCVYVGGGRQLTGEVVLASGVCAIKRKKHKFVTRRLVMIVCLK